MERNYQDMYRGNSAYGRARDDRFYHDNASARFSDRQRQTWNRPGGNEGSRDYGRDRRDPLPERNERRANDYNRNYNKDYNRNYNSDYNRDYNSYRRYRRNHSHDSDQERSSQDRHFGARAQGDYSGGTRYGEGGSTYGGGSGYGHSSYGTSGNQGNYSRGRSQYHSVNAQDGYESFMDRDSRNYCSYGGYRHEEMQQPRYRSGANTGYDRGSEAYNPTGYGATRYNNRDEDRMRSLGNNDEYTRSWYRSDYHREV